VQNSQIEILVGKFLSIIFVMFATLTTVLIINFIGSFIVNSIISNQVPVENFTIDIFNYTNGITLQLLLSILVITFYIIIGFSISFLLKNMIFPSIILLLYGLLLPVLGAYDFRNIFSYFSHKVFNFTARFEMFTPKPINEINAILIIILTIIVLISITFIISKKRSSYN
jgi:hypothetical protein